MKIKDRSVWRKRCKARPDINLSKYPPIQNKIITMPLSQLNGTFEKKIMCYFSICSSNKLWFLPIALNKLKLKTKLPLFFLSFFHLLTI